MPFSPTVLGGFLESDILRPRSLNPEPGASHEQIPRQFRRRTAPHARAVAPRALAGERSGTSSGQPVHAGSRSPGHDGAARQMGKGAVELGALGSERPAGNAEPHHPSEDGRSNSVGQGWG